jgi:lysophospholipase L1-like esterase
MQYHHPEKTLAELPGGQEIADEMLAPFFGTDVRTYRESVRFARFVDRLPFEPGSTVVGLGDSITDDAQSWLEILRHLLGERRPEDGIELLNAGISGDTTSGLLGRFLDLLERDPAWIIILIGTNDVAFVRDPRTKSLVSREETDKNLRTLRDLTEALSEARLVWMTPPPAIEARVVESSSLCEPTWRNADLAEVARLVRGVAGEDTLVDLWEAFGDPPEPELLLPDGLHPSLAGQRAIAAALVEQLGYRR